MLDHAKSQPFYRADQVRELDRLAIDAGIPGFELMSRAGQAGFQLLQQRYPEINHRRFVVVCGVGNNAGDGYIIARLLHQAGIQVSVIQVGAGEKLSGDALTARQHALQHQVAVVENDLSALTTVDQSRKHDDNSASIVIIDALLGTGLTGHVRENMGAAIEAINQCPGEVFSVDIPSGLDANTGIALGACVVADFTLTFIGLKQGLVIGDGPNYVGELFFNDLSIPPQHYQTLESELHSLCFNTLMAALPPRQRVAHKGKFGHVLLIGGDAGMGGAIALAGEAALVCGAGLVSIATQEINRFAIQTRTPEIMVHGVATGRELSDLIDRCSVVVLGPGLGQSSWSEQLFQTTLNLCAENRKSLVLDADGLNLLSEGKIGAGHYLQDWILTPHPGEAARLLGQSNQVINADRLGAIKAIQQKYGGVCLLKGAGTLVMSSMPDQADTGHAGPTSDRHPKHYPLSVCLQGNPGMSAGGFGDVLSGVIGALRAQHLSARHSAELGVCLHALAADHEAEAHGERGMKASDLFPRLRALINARRRKIESI